MSVPVSQNMSATISASVDISSPSPAKAQKKAPKVKKVTPAKPRKTKLPAKDGVAAKAPGKASSPRKGKSAVESSATKWIITDLPKAKGKRSLDDMVKAFTTAKGSSKGAVNLMFIDNQSAKPKAKGKPKAAKASSPKKEKKTPVSKANAIL